MDNFTFHAPTRVEFGEGVRHRLPDHMSSGPWGVLSSPSVLKESGIAEVLDECARNGLEPVHLGSVSPNPRLSEVAAALARARDSSAVGLIAVGGGSVLDAGKVLRVAFSHGATAREVLENIQDVIDRPSASTRIPLIAVPTTAGTGAEVSRGAIITDDATGRKQAARGDSLIPDVALVDPDLTASLSRQRAAETGFDVIAHAIETFFSRASTPITDLFARSALRETPAALIAVLDSGDREARRTLALHSWLMGYNLAHASTCLPHRMQYPIGSVTDTGHQIGLAALYPAWIRRAAEAVPERAVEVTEALSSAVDQRGLPNLEEAMIAFLSRVGLRVGLRDLGLREEDLPGLAEAVTGRIDLDPMNPDSGVISAIFEESWVV